ncbi:MAG: hypothetical protein JWN74_2305 [Acidobacteriaceae bacterium]|nr:hypothetical protein [Acidobacteriaceae bacterium]
MTILPREQSDNVDQRLRELCLARMPGTQITNTINSEMGLDWTLQAYWGRVRRLELPWNRTEKAGQPHPSTEYLPENKRATCREDPAYEGRNGILDRVICRECFAILRDGAMHGKRGHLWTIHKKMSLETYWRRNPGVRIFTFERIARQAHIDLDKYVAKEVANYGTPDELKAAQKNPRYEEDNGITQYVICRVERCGFKSICRLAKHLDNAHGMSTKEYRRDRSWPIMTAEELDNKAKFGRSLYANRKRLAWRPDNWGDQPASWRLIATELLSREDHMPNAELITRLMSSRTLISLERYGQSAQEIGNNQAFKKLVNDVRKWIRRPGRRGR